MMFDLCGWFGGESRDFCPRLASLKKSGVGKHPAWKKWVFVKYAHFVYCFCDIKHFKMWVLVPPHSTQKKRRWFSLVRSFYLCINSFLNHDPPPYTYTPLPPCASFLVLVKKQQHAHQFQGRRKSFGVGEDVGLRIGNVVGCHCGDTGSHKFWINLCHKFFKNEGMQV